MNTSKQHKFWLCALMAVSLATGMRCDSWAADAVANANQDQTVGSGSPTTAGKTADSTANVPPEVTEGPCHAVQIIAGPFDIHRRYRSMEGPWVTGKFHIGDAVMTGDITIPENKVRYVENNNEVPPSMNSMNSSETTDRQRNPLEEIEGMIDTSKMARSLYWLKGIKLEVLDENGEVMPTPEFICHSNVEMEPSFHNRIFPEGERYKGGRLFSITQGQTSIMFPSGYGMPFAGDEVFRLSLQAANRTTDKHRRIKHRATFYFLKDSELVTPITALVTRSNYVTLIIDKATDEAQAAESKKFPHCDLAERAVNAPNNVIGGTEMDKFGRRVSGHWVVPPGQHSYSSVIGQNDTEFFNRPRKIRAAWVHVHPFCEHVALTKCTGRTDAAEKGKREYFTADIETNTVPGLTIKDIQPHIGPDGVLLPKGPFQLVGKYNNTSPQAVDSMVSLGLFLEDKTFSRPMWALPDHVAEYCGISSCRISEAQTNHAKPAAVATERTSSLSPMFDIAKDGPLLTEPLKLQVTTTAGNLQLLMDPSLAPITVTQMAKLFQVGAFDLTRIARYIPGFVLQVGTIEDKVLGTFVKQDHWNMNRRLPLETKSAVAGKLMHKKYCLSMSREVEDENSAGSSFSILLCDAPHMDGKYTVFGYLNDDEETRNTIERITSEWDAERPLFVSAKVIKPVQTASSTAH